METKQILKKKKNVLHKHPVRVWTENPLGPKPATCWHEDSDWIILLPGHSVSLSLSFALILFSRSKIPNILSLLKGSITQDQNLKLECVLLRISWNEGCEKCVWRTICSQLTAAAPVIYSECVRCIRVALMAKLCPKKITACQDPGSVATAIWHYVQFSPMQTVNMTQSENDRRRISRLPQRVFLRSFDLFWCIYFPWKGRQAPTPIGLLQLLFQVASKHLLSSPAVY